MHRVCSAMEMCAARAALGSAREPIGGFDCASSVVLIRSRRVGVRAGVTDQRKEVGAHFLTVDRRLVLYSSAYSSTPRGSTPHRGKRKRYRISYSKRDIYVTNPQIHRQYCTRYEANASESEPTRTVERGGAKGGAGNMASDAA